MQQQYSNQDHVVNFYEILGLPQPRPQRGRGSPTQITKDDVKVAYHRALLLYHPDKAPKKNDSDLQFGSGAQDVTAHYSIDQIMRAYQILAEPRLRVEYNKQLWTNDTRKNLLEDAASHKGTHLGVEVCDLEDLDYNEEKTTWSKACRCGSKEGYMVTESELEKESNQGEIYVGCRGCSLFIKVLFGLIED